MATKLFEVCQHPCAPRRRYERRNDAAITALANQVRAAVLADVRILLTECENSIVRARSMAGDKSNVGTELKHALNSLAAIRTCQE
jgi:hypothetical protein